MTFRIPRVFLLLAVLFGLSGCAVPMAGQAPGPRLGPEAAARNFEAVLERVEPVAERVCRQETRGVDCDFIIGVIDDLEAPPNAFQTLDEDGRPVVGFTIALVADVRNADELAFIMGHEAAHHISGHIPRAREGALVGAHILGNLAALGGGDAADVEQAVRLGAALGARRFSKEFELEADVLGAQIAARAGFDPVRGAQYFNRIPDPGDRFLGTHPPNAERMATVRRVAAGL